MNPALVQSMHASGLGPVSDIRDAVPGKLLRYRVQGDRAGSKNGWVIFHEHPIEAASFGSWKTGQTVTWRGAAAPGALVSRREQDRLLAQMRAQRLEEQELVHQAARKKAQHLWAVARPATYPHPYLAKKQVPAYGIRVLRESLLVPARDESGELRTLQFIRPDGQKTFLSGGRIKGCYFSIGRTQSHLLICEGYATAATLFKATGYAVAVAFSCGNLAPVALALRKKFPRLQIVICADNDSGKSINPGVTNAVKAAQAVSGLVAIPNFKRSLDEHRNGF